MKKHLNWTTFFFNIFLCMSFLGKITYFGMQNKEGNVFLIPTKKFKEQMDKIKFLRDFRDINYHASPVLEYNQ